MYAKYINGDVRKVEKKKSKFKSVSFEDRKDRVESFMKQAKIEKELVLRKQ